MEKGSGKEGAGWRLEEQWPCCNHGSRSQGGGGFSRSSDLKVGESKEEEAHLHRPSVTASLGRSASPCICRPHYTSMYVNFQMGTDKRICKQYEFLVHSFDLSSLHILKVQNWLHGEMSKMDYNSTTTTTFYTWFSCQEATIVNHSC